MENQIVKINEVELNSSNSIIVINKNIENINKEVEKELSKDCYNSIVTMENFKDMKLSSQQLGKIAKQISDFRIAKKNDEMEDINKFDASLKNFTQMFKNKQNEIKEGLNVFEEKTRQKVLTVCKEYFEEYCEEVQLRKEFKDINLDDMTLTKYATATFKISKAGKDEVQSRVNSKLTLQTKVDNRLLNLENECLKANITPMSKEYVQGFLYEDDNTYTTKLNDLINVEKARAEQEKKRIEEQARIKAEAEAKEKYIKEQEQQKQELKLKYEPLISNANFSDLTKINLELNSYDGELTYELKQLCNKREQFLEDEKHQTKIITKEQAEANKTPFEEDIAPVKHIKEIVKETPKNGKIKKYITVTFDVEVPVNWQDKVKDVYTERFKENIKGVNNLLVEVK